MAPFIAITVLAALAWLFFDNIRAREAGVIAARSACIREGLQFLDETVSLSAWRFERDENGRLKIQRSYAFEFSDTGNNRLGGSITLLGAEVTMLFMQAREAPAREREIEIPHEED